MQPYELSDFYMPYPARLNPHLDTAREHTKAWAREMGMLDSPSGNNATGQPGADVWDEAEFDSMDFALLCAYTHPDAPSPTSTGTGFQPDRIRRGTLQGRGDAPWSAGLVEHATFVEILARIANTRPMRVLKDTFSDGVHLRNDLFSYQRETEQESEINNCVLPLLSA